jgi:pantoate--beta-alanine ligase
VSVALIETAREFKELCADVRRDGPLGLVPTMGYLHAGHQSLIRQAAQRTSTVAATIFVNPTQFGPHEDLARYPRDLDGDLKKCEEAGAKFVFAPRSPSEMYPAGYETYIEPGALAVPLDGASRPGHFRGVCTIVGKLFAMSRAEQAFFGEKDFQQLAVIQRMARDLDFSTEVIGCPIVREPDGLAMSSRNAYLTAEERPRAVALSRALSVVQEQFASGMHEVSKLEELARRELEKAELRVDYVEIRNAIDLAVPVQAGGDARLFIAAFLGKTRLIDNGPVIRALA